MIRLRSQTIKAEAFLPMLLSTGEYYFIDFLLSLRKRELTLTYKGAVL